MHPHFLLLQGTEEVDDIRDTQGSSRRSQCKIALYTQKCSVVWWLLGAHDWFNQEPILWAPGLTNQTLKETLERTFVTLNELETITVEVKQC